jgi:4-carboxymuconolactone decarboxylase
MNKLLAITMSVVAPFSSAADVQGPPRTPTAGSSQQITRAGDQAAVTGSSEYFTGRVRVDPLFSVMEKSDTSGAYVTFEPGARSAWHTHPAGQRLVVVSGVGLTQQEGKPIQKIRPGDVVVCPPGVKHWHGAARTTAMTHFTVTGSVDGKTVEWMEKVTDDEYNSH